MNQRIKEILLALEVGEIDSDEALQNIEAALKPVFPTAVITIAPEKGIDVQLENWTGISMTKMELAYHQLLAAVQRHRAKGLLEMRREEKQNAA